MNCNTTHYRANSSSVPGDPTIIGELARGAPGRRWKDGLAQQLGRIAQTAQAARLAPADLSDVRTRLQQAAEALGIGLAELALA